MNIGQLQIVPVREAFRHEAHNFTVWLETHINALSERIGIELTVLQREKSVGSFIVDLVCQDAGGNFVIIENQLERTDHDHLGKILTYLVNIEAKTAIWVTPEVRSEHERVIDWLNEVAGAEFAFYLVKVEAVKIADSPYAPLFTVVVAPDKQTAEIGAEKKELAQVRLDYREFWTSLFEKTKSRMSLFTTISPSTSNYVSTGAGRTGCQFGFSIRKNDASVWVGLNSRDADLNKKSFDALYAEKDAIEKEFGGSFDWDYKDNQVRLFVSHMIEGMGGLDTRDKWDSLQNEMIARMLRLDQTFRKRIANLKF